jgi:hypothetical protein
VAQATPSNCPKTVRKPSRLTPDPIAPTPSGRALDTQPPISAGSSAHWLVPMRPRGNQSRLSGRQCRRAARFDAIRDPAGRGES